MGGSINYHSAEILIKWNLLTNNDDAVKSSKCQKYFFQDAVDPTLSIVIFETPVSCNLR